MTTIEELKQIITKKESQTLEFKTSTAKLQAAFETMCAFLNGKGGEVLIGVNDKGSIVGQDVSDSTQQAIAKELSRLEPSAMGQIDVEYVTVSNNKQVIVFHVKAGSHPPYVYEGRAFYRNQSTTMRMAQDRYEQLIVERGQLIHAWEELPANDYAIASLDLDEIHLTVKKGVEANRIPLEALDENIEQTLKRMRLLTNDKLNQAAIVLFAKEIPSDYFQCTIKMARFSGLDKTGSFIDNQRFSGDLFQILSEANRFVMRHLPIASFFDPDRFEREDKPALPVLAVREALINALCHRDYADRASTISLAIYDDRLEIWNIGTLPPKLKLSDLKVMHDSFPRNKLIAQVVYNRGLSESWGSGTLRMIKRCQEHGIPEPEFSEYSGGFSVTFRFKEPIGATLPATRVLTQRQEEILAILRLVTSLSAHEIFQQLSSPPSLRTVKADLAVLKKQGLIYQADSARNAVWAVKK